VSTEAVSVGVPERCTLVAGLSQRWHLVGLTAVLAVAAFLDFYRLEQNGYANEYYAG
jgi:hypothetical protein